MSEKEAKRSPTDKPVYDAESPHEEELQAKLPPNLKAEIDLLRRHEKKILESLSGDDEMKNLFIADPGAALTRMGIKVPPLIKQRLKASRNLLGVGQPQEFMLPNGQVVSPRVRINFTGQGKR